MMGLRAIALAVFALSAPMDTEHTETDAYCVVDLSASYRALYSINRSISSVINTGAPIPSASNGSS